MDRTGPYCRLCGVQSDRGDTFCSQCGAPLTGPLTVPSPSSALPPLPPLPVPPPGYGPSRPTASPLNVLIVVVIVAGLIGAAAAMLGRLDVNSIGTFGNATFSNSVYIHGAQDRLDMTAEASGELSELLMNPQFGDLQWIEDVGLQLAVFNAVYLQEKAAQVPSEHVDVHATLLEIFGLMDDAADDIAFGVDTYDVDSLDSATDKFTRADALATESDIQAEITRRAR